MTGEQRMNAMFAPWVVNCMVMCFKGIYMNIASPD